MCLLPPLMLADILLYLETWLPGLETWECFEVLSALLFTLPPTEALPTLMLFSRELVFSFGAGRTDI